MVAENPDMYQHPSPSGINPNWQTEMDAGPHMASRGRKKTNTSDTRRPRTSMTQLSNVSEGPSSLDLSSSAVSRDGRNDSKFDFKQYQREDELLWGSASMERLALGASEQPDGIIAKPPRARVRGADTETSYAKYRNPQLNELHPATVTKLSSRQEARWMFQGPPNADVMKGRERAPRSRSDSGNSNRPSAKSPVLSSVSRGSSIRTPNFVTVPPRYPQLDRTTMEERDFAQDGDDSKDQEPLRTASVQAHIRENSDESDATVVRSPNLAPQPLRKQQSRKTASKPQLSPIVSDSMSHDENGPLPLLEKPKENNDRNPRDGGDSISEHDWTSRRSTLRAEDDSLKVLRDLAPSSAIFNTAVVSTDDLAKASKYSTRLTSRAGQDRNNPDFDPEVFESWVSADFELPEWIHEHTKREVKERWSMDI